MVSVSSSIIESIIVNVSDPTKPTHLTEEKEIAHLL
jgi:hypothetical protein